MSTSEHYTRTFYKRLRNGAARSAEVIAPLVLQLLPVRCVVDIGCGDGSWLAVFRKLGIEEILGIDGEYVDRDLLQIPQKCFRTVDLTNRFDLGRTFDLAISLEVAEHLEPDCAPVFVQCLARLAPAVLFSAAIPFQGGDHHVNEQWPDKWASLFRECGYVPIDFIRRRVWQNESVEFWYAQNTLLFAHTKLIGSNPSLKAEFERTNPEQLCLVHPRQYLYSLSQIPQAPQVSGVRSASHLLWVCLRNSVREKLKGKVSQS